ncbi:MAG: M20/M25/M40 family metallo-hydrolase [Candidatus Micrarchaeota archaeon]|nr:M20/M25/M40 family metallo-hydrolase [Candidatus Micrarchaeota archaeon]
MDKELVELFCKLVSIPSPSGKEREVLNYVKSRLSKLGIASHFDDAGSKVGSDSGNLIAKLGSGKPSLLFMAHVDTVEDGKRRIKPVIKGNVIRSDGETILGSDDKAGVAALLGAIKAIRSLDKLPSITCAFSVREEAGIMGANYLGVTENVDYAFDVDGSNPPGLFINKALGNLAFELEIKGKESHAAADPEGGRNAIKAAAIMVAQLKLGRGASGSTLNIGKISGGKANNIIPGKAVLTGELRAYKKTDMEKDFKALEKAAQHACMITGCTYKLRRESYDAPLNVPEKGRIVSLSKAAAASAGLRFTLKTIRGTIQASALAARGYDVLGLSKGGKHAHSTDECIGVKELADTRNLIVELVKQSKKF